MLGSKSSTTSSEAATTSAIAPPEPEMPNASAVSTYQPLLPDLDVDPEASPVAVVVHLLGATRLPRLEQLNRSSINPHVVMWVVDHHGSIIGEATTWAPRWVTRNPVWNCAHDLKLPPMPYKDLKRALLHVEVWDHDGMLPPNPVGQIDVPLLTLSSDTHIPVPLAPSPLCSVEPYPSVDMVSSVGYPRRKRLYLIRHGESEWNKAQASLDALSMYSQVDHPLSATGHTQAEELAAKLAAALHAEGTGSTVAVGTGDGAHEATSSASGSRTALDTPAPDAPAPDAPAPDAPAPAAAAPAADATSADAPAPATADVSAGDAPAAEPPAPGSPRPTRYSAPPAPPASSAEADVAEAAALRDLCASGLVLCSPLTRALQTALFALGPTLAARRQPIYLAPSARERINPGSVDSFGAAIGGAEVKARLHAKTAELLAGDDAAAKALVGGIALDDLEVCSRWWTNGPEGAVGVAGVNQRLADMMDQVRYAPEESIVLVGHSHYFRELLRFGMHDDFVARAPELASRLKSRKLSNCGVACLELDFEASPTAPIVGVTLLAGTELVK